MALINFNAANVETQTNFDPLPNGWYTVVMAESEMKPTQAGTGHYLECQLKVIDGSFNGRLLWLRLNLDNPNETAVEIAYKQLATICQAVGVVQVNDSSEIHNKPFQVKVVVRPPKGEYDASNDIKGFKAVDGNSGAGVSAATGGEAAPAWSAKKQQKKEPVQEKSDPAPKETKPAWSKPETEETAAEDTTVESEPEPSASAKPAWMQ